MFTHSSLTDRIPCSWSHRLVMPDWVASVRARCQGPFLLRASGMAAVSDVPSFRNSGTIGFALRLPSDGPSRFGPRIRSGAGSCLRLVLMQMTKGTLAGFTYRGLAPHTFTPMPGVYRRLESDKQPRGTHAVAFSEVHWPRGCLPLKLVVNRARPQHLPLSSGMMTVMVKLLEGQRECTI